MKDPIKNAKTLAFLFFLGALSMLLDVINGNATAYTILSLAVYAAVGYGLRTSKLWGVYALGVLVLLSVYDVFQAYSSTGELATGNVVILAIFIVIFAWLFSARSKFK